MTVGCASPPPPPQGVTLSRETPTEVAGSYREGETTIRFQAVIRDDARTVTIFDGAGRELARATMGESLASSSMSHYGVAQPLETDALTAEALRWLESREARLVAALPRALVGKDVMTQPPTDVLLRYANHLGEVLARAAGGDGAEKPHRCDDCFGACGPGCTSIDLGWVLGLYCYLHACCCDHYGGWSCYTWCFVAPWCPDPFTDVCPDPEPPPPPSCLPSGADVSCGEGDRCCSGWAYDPSIGFCPDPYTWGICG